MRLLRAKLTNGCDHWINPALYQGLEFHKEPGNPVGRVFCHYHGGSHTSVEATNIEELVADYEKAMRGE